MADLVESWKHVARKHMLRGRPARGANSPHVRITHSFVLLAAVVGMPFGPLAGLATLVVLPTVLLAHELPRALLACGMGRSAEVRFSLLGGSTQISGAPLRGFRRFAFEGIGSALNLVTAAAGFATLHPGLPPGTAAIIGLWAYSHAAWGLGQAIPLLPFRAGQALSARLMPASRFAHAALSAAVLITAVTFLIVAHPLPVLLPVAELAAFAAFAAAIQAHAESSDDRSGVSALAERAAASLRANDASAAADAAARGLPAARSLRVRTAFAQTLAWSVIALRDPVRAHLAVAQIPESELDYYLIASYLSCCNRIDEAVQLLRQARDFGHRDAEGTKLLIDLLYRSGDLNGALAVARADDTLLSADDRRIIATALPERGG